MKTRKVSDDLVSPIREKVLELLEKPYAGTKAFRYNHPDAKYVSNCHGAMAYVFGLEDPAVKERAHPGIISDGQMEELIEKYFLPSDEPDVGNLIGFYENPNSDDETILHTALLIGANGKIFQQSGTGGIFEPKTIEERLKSLTALESKDVEVRSYTLRS